MKKFAAIAGICAALGLTACNADTTAKNGDNVIINFAGYLDGVQFPGGTAENVPLTLGAGKFVPGFEEQIIGMKEGEERDINITFPEQYVPDLAGKSVIFKIKLIDIVK